MDGENLEEKYNLKESVTEKDGLLSLQTSCHLDGGFGGGFYSVYLVDVLIISTFLYPSNTRVFCSLRSNLLLNQKHF